MLRELELKQIYFNRDSMLIYASITRKNSQLCKITFLEITMLEQIKIVHRGRLIPTFSIIRKHSVRYFHVLIR